MGWQMEALVASLGHDVKRAKKAPLGSITLPSSGTGTEGRFVCVSPETVEALLLAVADHPSLLIPQSGPGQDHPGLISPGRYTFAQVVELLRKHSKSPRVIRFLADMLKP